jgi:hypothetical protein
MSKSIFPTLKSTNVVGANAAKQQTVKRRYSTGKEKKLEAGCERERVVNRIAADRVHVIKRLPHTIRFIFLLFIPPLLLLPAIYISLLFLAFCAQAYCLFI